MNKQTIIGNALPNIPWEDRPDDCCSPVWRSANNPVIGRHAVGGTSCGVFNSSAVPFGDGFAGVFRVLNNSCDTLLYTGHSADGIHWTFDESPIQFICDDPEIAKFDCKYDPRVCFFEDRYYVMWCNHYYGPTIGLAYTFDFKTYYQMENCFLPFNRNAVLFPRKINGKYMMLSRPCDGGHCQNGEIFVSESDDLIYWGRHRHVMGPYGAWQSTKIGAGPVPIETSEGWLLFYHGVGMSCNGMVYSMGAALLDIDQPSKVLYRTKPYLLYPETLYECTGNTPNVVFPVATLQDAPTGRIAIYSGAADSVSCLAYTQVDLLLDFVKKNSF